MSAVSGFLTERLRLARARSGFTSKSETARALGVGLSTYRAWENGQNGLNVENAIEIAQTFGVRWEWLLAGQGEMIDVEAEGMAMMATPDPVPVTSSNAPTSDVVIQAQHEIEVYQNSSGGIVVKMEAGGVYEEDQVVVIRPENVDAVVAALLRVKEDAIR